LARTKISEEELEKKREEFHIKLYEVNMWGVTHHHGEEMMRKDIDDCQTVEDVLSGSEATIKQMSEIVYHAHRCWGYEPFMTPRQILDRAWSWSPGNIDGIFGEYYGALFYFYAYQDGKIIRHQLPEIHDFSEESIMEEK